MPTLRSGVRTQKDEDSAPQSSKKCTYKLGFIRQTVYLCLTCTPTQISNPLPESHEDRDGQDPRGICASCSFVCHGSHRRIELFQKRHFRCDCCTAGIKHSCSLEKKIHKSNDPISLFEGDNNTEGNIYGQNFRGLFCRCARFCDPKLEDETMVQCLNCEDWFHHSCLNLCERPGPRTHSPGVEHNAPLGSTPSGLMQAFNTDDSPLTSARSQEVGLEQYHTLPRILLPGSAYDTLICGSCVLDNPTLRLYAGTRNVKMIVRRPGSAWEVLHEPHDTKGGGNCTSKAHESKPTKRRNRDDEQGGRDTKRVRMELEAHADVSHPSTSGSGDETSRAMPTISCRAPAPNAVAAQVLKGLASKQFKAVAIDAKEEREEAVEQVQADRGEEDTEMFLVTGKGKGVGVGAVPTLGEVERAGVQTKQTWDGQGDIFLTKGWRERWCQCSSCLPPLKAQPYLLSKEETYEPEDVGVS